MSDTKDNPAPSPPPPAKPSPEEEANARVQAVQAQINDLKRDIRTSQGRFANRDPDTIKAITRENEELRKRLVNLEKALYALVEDSFKPRNAEEEKLQFEILRQAGTEFCQKANVDPEIWKNLAY